LIESLKADDFRKYHIFGLVQSELRFTVVSVAAHTLVAGSGFLALRTRRERVPRRNCVY
jgi:hypothetical protein